MSQIEVKMPQMGVSVTEGTVTAWHKQPGDDVRADEPICDVATDKVDTEVFAPADGVLATIVVAEGETAEIGAALALLAVEGEVVEGESVAVSGDGELAGVAAVASQQPAGSAARAGAGASASNGAAANGSAATVAMQPPESYVPSLQVPDDEPHAPATVSAQPFDHVRALAETAARGGRHRPPFASPVARRLAGDLGIDLHAVAGSGARGRIRKADVLAARDGATATTAAAASGAPQPIRDDAARQAATAAPSGDAPQPATSAPSTAPAAQRPALATGTAQGDALPRGYDDVPYELVPTSHVRKVTADHMIRSRQTAAHMTTEVEVDMQLVASVRARLNAERIARGQAKLSYLPFLTRVACHMLGEYPNLNATFERERYIRWREVNVGIAVDTPQGLMVPVVRGAQELTVEALAQRIADLAEGARARTLDADAFRAGTFTITNPGSVGAISAMAIINQPQVAILGVPAIVRRPWVVTLPDGGETIAIRPILQLAITFDHRAIDGAEATRAAVLMKRCLESWNAEAYR